MVKTEMGSENLVQTKNGDESAWVERENGLYETLLDEERFFTFLFSF